MKSNSKNGKASKTDSTLHINKKVAGGATGAVVGAVMGGPVGALIGGVVGTAIGTMGESPSSRKRSMASMRALTKSRSVFPRKSSAKAKFRSQNHRVKTAAKKTDATKPSVKKAAGKKK